MSAIASNRALDHARREQSGQLHRIRFFVDWGHDCPLWESFTDKNAMEPDDYGISSKLGRRINDWSHFWQCHFDPFGGCDEPRNENRWLATGEVMVGVLEVEVFDIAVVLPRFRHR